MPVRSRAGARHLDRNRRQNLCREQSNKTGEAMMDQREAFEEWAKDSGYALLKTGLNQYFYGDTGAAWDAWQAARAQGGEAVAYVEKYREFEIDIAPVLTRVIFYPEMDMLKNGTKLYTHPVPSVPEDLRDRLRDALTEALGEAMDCTRVWSAWGLGTMGQDDFQVITEDGERLEEVVDAVLSVITTPPEQESE